MCISERQRILLKSISNSLSIYIYMDKLNYIYIYDKLYTYMINYVIFFLAVVEIKPLGSYIVGKYFTIKLHP
jgi:hypothetical protein